MSDTTTPTLIPTTCPNCGAGDLDGFSILAMERLIGHAEIRVFDNGKTAEWGGGTTVLWDTSTTQEYFCSACGNALPEKVQAALDRALGNERGEMRS